MELIYIIYALIGLGVAIGIIDSDDYTKYSLSAILVAVLILAAIWPILIIARLARNFLN